MPYSIIIPIYNEVNTLISLLKSLKRYYELGHEIIIIDDGSTDQSNLILKECSFIKLIVLNRNHGKGIALREGLKSSINNKTIIYDGDLELETNNILKLMILNKKGKIHSVLGIRFKRFRPFKSGVDWGNFIFAMFLNSLQRTSYRDVLCCAKSFYKTDIPLKKLKSQGFDIDIEMTIFLTKSDPNKNIKQVLLNYNRRSFAEGKKLKISDGWIILRRILFSF